MSIPDSPRKLKEKLILTAIVCACHVPTGPFFLNACSPSGGIILGDIEHKS